MKRVATASPGLDPITAADEEPCVAPPQQLQLQQHQPAKRVKMEGEGGDEPPATPSAARSQYAVNLVQQTIDELQQDCQRAFRESRKSLARAEAAEEQNRTLQLEFDEFKQKTKEAEQRNAKKLDQMKRELDESRRGAADREQEAREKVASLTRQLEAKQSQFIHDLLRDGIGGLLRKLPVSLVESEREARESEEQLKEKVVSLTHQLEAEQSQVIQDLLRYRIDELTLKLALDEISQLQQSQEMEEGLQPTLEQQLQGNVLHAPMQQQQQLPSSQFEKEKEPDDRDTVLISPPRRRRWSQIHAPEWETVPHATNLLQLCDPNRAGTISCYNAFHQLRPLYPGEMKKDLRSSGMLKHEITCRGCDFQRNRCIMDHFLSTMHMSAMLESRAAVSLAAFEYWRNKLGQAVNQLLKERRDEMNAEKPNKDHAPVVGKEARVYTDCYGSKCTLLHTDNHQSNSRESM